MSMGSSNPDTICTSEGNEVNVNEFESKYSAEVSKGCSSEETREAMSSCYSQNNDNGVLKPKRKHMQKPPQKILIKKELEIVEDCERKDRYGNVIQKGSKKKVIFADSKITNRPLVQIHLLRSHQQRQPVNKQNESCCAVF